MDKRINSLEDAKNIIERNLHDQRWLEEADDDLRKARLFAADILQQARENHFSGGALVAASAYIMAASIASTTTSKHMAKEVREMVIDNTVAMMRWALKDFDAYAKEQGLD